MNSPPTADPRVNVADRLAEHARERPDSLAVVSIAEGKEITFAQLDRDANQIAEGLIGMGVRPGHRMALLVKPGIEFVTLVFALLRSGATMVLVDAGLGKRNIVRCLESTSPDGFVAIPQGHAMRVFLRRRFPGAKLNVTVGRRWFWRGATLASLREGVKSSTPPADVGGSKGGDPAAIVFTSGSTGPPKGVVYTHQTFVTQASEIEREYDLQPGAVDLACFPLFGLFNVACGVTTVLPEMDFSRPASCDPKKLFAAANDWKVSQSFASPAVWDRLSRYALASGQSIPTLRRIFSCGAPVPAEVIRHTLAMAHPDAQLHTPYGATESLPVATIEAQEILNETAEKTDQGAGVCVGRRFESIDWRVIKITDDPIATIDDVKELPQGEIGELIVCGPQVSRKYLGDPEAPVPRKLAPGVHNHNALSKIQDGNTIWHRIGDVGYFDAQQRFWYCGRKSQRVVTSEGPLFTTPIEAIFNALPMVHRTALVGIGSQGYQTPVLVYESTPLDRMIGRAEHPSIEELTEVLRSSIREAAAAHDVTRGITYFLAHPKLPTDIRHNSKIRREELAVWAAKQLRKKGEHR